MVYVIHTLSRYHCHDAITTAAVDATDVAAIMPPLNTTDVAAASDMMPPLLLIWYQWYDTIAAVAAAPDMMPLIWCHDFADVADSCRHCYDTDAHPCLWYDIADMIPLLPPLLLFDTAAATYTDTAAATYTATAAAADMMWLIWYCFCRQYYAIAVAVATVDVATGCCWYVAAALMWYAIADILSIMISLLPKLLLLWYRRCHCHCSWYDVAVASITSLSPIWCHCCWCCCYCHHCCWYDVTAVMIPPPLPLIWYRCCRCSPLLLLLWYHRCCCHCRCCYYSDMMPPLVWYLRPCCCWCCCCHCQYHDTFVLICHHHHC